MSGNLLRVLGIGVLVTMMTLLIKPHKPELSIALPILAVCAILFCIAPYLKGILSMFEELASRGGLESRYLHMVMKIVGVAYLCQFGAELCKDAGENSLASNIELAGKVMILTLSMPAIYRLLDLVSAIINF